MSLSTSNQILTAFFDSRSEAENAIDRMISEGIDRDAITIVEGADASGEKHRKGFFEMLGDLFMPHEDRHAYAEGLRRGGYFVSVPTTAANHERVRDILDDEGTIDLTAREANWRAEGWAGTESEYDAIRTGETARTDRSALFEAGPNPGPSGTAARGQGAAPTRIGRRDSSAADTRTRSYVFDDLAAHDQLHRQEEAALGYDSQTAHTETASEMHSRTDIDIDDQRRVEEEERLRGGERNR